MDDMVIVAQLGALTKCMNGCNMRCYIILRARENRVLCTKKIDHFVDIDLTGALFPPFDFNAMSSLLFEQS